MLCYVLCLRLTQSMEGIVPILARVINHQYYSNTCRFQGSMFVVVAPRPPRFSSFGYASKEVYCIFSHTKPTSISVYLMLEVSMAIYLSKDLSMGACSGVLCADGRHSPCNERSLPSPRRRRRYPVSTARPASIPILIPILAVK